MLENTLLAYTVELCGGALLLATPRFDSAMAVLLLALASVVILKSFGFRGAPVVTVLALVVALSSYSALFSEISDTFSYIEGLSDVREYVSAVIKVVGISYLSGICSDVAREMGESGCAKAISVITKLELVLLSLPYIKQILFSVFSLLEK